MKALLIASVASVICSAAVSAERPMVDIIPGQMSSLLQLTIAKIEPQREYSHKCWVDEKDHEYNCLDKIGDIAVVYYAPTEKEKVTRIAIGAKPSDFPLAANIGGALMVIAGEQVKAGAKAKNSDAVGPLSIKKATDQFENAFLNGLGFYDLGKAKAVFTRTDDHTQVLMHISPKQ